MMSPASANLPRAAAAPRQAWTCCVTAQAGFDAARRVGPATAPRLQGHGFTVQAAGVLPTGWAPFGGGEVPALLERLQARLAPLEGGLVNDHVGNDHAHHGTPDGHAADDAALAAWVADGLGLPAEAPLARISLQPHARQGVHLLDAGTPAARVIHWRRYRFQSAHRLPHVGPHHKCGRMHGHGFEAVVQANVPPAQIDDAWAPLHMALNYRCLNDIDGLHNPTSEVLSSWLWQRLATSLPGLLGVTVFETASCGAHFDGAQHHIWKDFSFDSATQLRRAPAGHERASLHGHTYGLRLHLQAPLDPVLGWAVDFGVVKNAFKPVFEAIDHRTLDRLKGLEDGDCESLARWIAERAQPLLPALRRVDLCETPGNGVALLAGGVDQPLLPAWA